MLKVFKDNSIEIHKGDAFSLMCHTDAEIENVEQLVFYLLDESNKIILEKHAKRYENGVFFVFNSEETNIHPNVYNYVIKYIIDDTNGTTIHNNSLKVRQCV